MRRARRQNAELHETQRERASVATTGGFKRVSDPSANQRAGPLRATPPMINDGWSPSPTVLDYSSAACRNLLLFHAFTPRAQRSRTGDLQVAALI